MPCKNCFLLIFVLQLLLSTAESELNIERSKIWSRCDFNNSCSCGSDISKAVQCSEDFLWIQPCYCIYYDQNENRSIVGYCLFTCYNHSISHTGSIYYSIKQFSVQNAFLFNDAVCSVLGDIHREGRFCGRCKQDYGLAVYSYDIMNCIPCKDYGYKNWLKYFAVALIPLTIFYILATSLKISVTSSHLNGTIFVMQCIMSPKYQRVLAGSLYYKQNILRQGSSFTVRVALILCSIFNLDFFRAVFPDVCLHPHFNFLHVVSLDFIVALYPFSLILLTYILITMYDKNYCLVVWAWKPFKWCLQHYNRKFEVRTSLIETFATFILLSNVKILGVCFDILFSTRAFNDEGKSLYTRYLYYDASIEYFSREHIPYVVLALCIGCVFVLIPFLLLLLYPCRCFQKFLNLFGCRCQGLHIFMDAFQGSYRTEPYDMRYFSAYYLFLRIFLFIIVMNIHSVYAIPIVSMVMVLGAVIFTVFHPYKNSRHNRCDVILMLLTAFIFLTCTAYVMATSIDFYWERNANFLLSSSYIALFCSYALVLTWKTAIPKMVWNWCVAIYKKRSTQEIYETLDRSDIDRRDILH